MVLAEAAKRKSAIPQFVDRDFAAQAKFILDPSRKKAAICTRRAGKTNGVARMMLKSLVDQPSGDILYLGLTKNTVRRLMWEPILKPLNRQLGINAEPNETTMSLKLTETSHIYCLGADADEEEMQKLLGGKYKLVVIDEAQSFRIDMHKLVNQVLRAALSDLRGTICLTGTPDDLTSGLFYDITRQDGRRLGSWSVHEWSAADNPYMVNAWADEIEEIKSEYPLAYELPWFQRMYLGKWVTDTDSLVYKFSNNLNTCESLPNREWTYILGIDLGFNDASAFTLFAYSNEEPCLYIVDTMKKSGLIVAEVANIIKDYRDRYEISYLPCDPASKQVVEELRQRYQIPLISAEKTEKDRYIEMMNSDFKLGLIKLLDSTTKPLQEEYSALIWDKAAARRLEHPSCKNDLCDSALYGWRHCRQYLYESAIKRNKTDLEVMDEFWDNEAEELASEKNKPFWEREIV
jgi:PBSX family phage terminase large subunit